MFERFSYNVIYCRYNILLFEIDYQKLLASDLTFKKKQIPFYLSIEQFTLKKIQNTFDLKSYKHFI